MSGDAGLGSADRDGWNRSLAVGTGKHLINQVGRIGSRLIYTAAILGPRM